MVGHEAAPEVGHEAAPGACPELASGACPEVAPVIRPIDTEELAQALGQLRGRRVFLHVEVTPGGWLRNLAADVEEAVLRSDGPTHRVALRCSGHGWVVMEGLTHMSLVAGEPLLLCTLAEEDRLTRVLQISAEVLAA
jgi:hypothetical protein